MYNDPAILDCWLSRVFNSHGDETTNANPNLKRPRELETTTPPSAATQTVGESPGPKKRKINDSRPESHEPGLDPDATPRSGRSLRLSANTLSMGTAFPLPSSLGYSSAASIVSDHQNTRSKNFRRRARPVKNIAGLQHLDKPIMFSSLDDNAEIEALYTDRPPPDSVYRKPGEGYSQDGIGQDEERVFDYFPLSALFSGTRQGALFQTRITHAELYKVRSIKVHARECSTLQRAEAAWNTQVHEPLLELALSRQHTSVIWENATSARILPHFLPYLVTGEVAEGKVVDFVLAPNLDSESELDFAIQNKLVAQAKQMKPSGFASGHLYVNQPDYHPLVRAPTAVTMVAKVAGASLEEGQLQLGIWTAAWHRRMETLGIGGGKLGPQLPTLPLILTHDHEWSLYFAVDRLNKIEVFGPIQIGMTDTLRNIYKLLTVLGFLGAWIDTTFRSWVFKAFCPRTD
ncbi:hypothetical protein CHGG_03762 [Chaetomium globosum CBS 148.51]|uniref:PD-(D/E)XK nuclease-like domain-containing protein n=1 Tax=Chaetomium globosum (strain ATCC 6205 / CBS 148.51 / DSM 1962 / NBRC 6347 / NRRL 1970) TaxID=306901 RepID=Q2H384_CHAGB|nr:uncharacterized protein CHGG_03762 [Chaetomium globosum CBS 148.51]EAQ87143.1 hypothetical protein CHGG_03762 [Chaetomium globosum CBS 148.51]